jgi:hypothetical protein
MWVRSAQLEGTGRVALGGREYGGWVRCGKHFRSGAPPRDCGRGRTGASWDGGSASPGEPSPRRQRVGMTYSQRRGSEPRSRKILGPEACHRSPFVSKAGPRSSRGTSLQTCMTSSPRSPGERMVYGVSSARSVTRAGDGCRCPMRTRSRCPRSPHHRQASTHLWCDMAPVPRMELRMPQHACRGASSTPGPRPRPVGC